MSGTRRVYSKHVLLFKLFRFIKDRMIAPIANIYFIVQLIQRKLYSRIPFKHESSSSAPVMIVLADWSEYPFRRHKKIGNKTFKCGLGPILEGIKKYNAGVPCKVIIVINKSTNIDESKYIELKKIYPFVQAVFFRNNQGADFGAYDHGYAYLKSVNFQGDVVFMNSSVRGPNYHHWLLRYKRLFHGHLQVGMCGCSMNSQSTHLSKKTFAPHIQSFFIYTSMKILKNVFPEHLPGYVDEPVKTRIISNGEICLSQAVLSEGHGICAMFKPKKIYFRGQQWPQPHGDLRYSALYKCIANLI